MMLTDLIVILDTCLRTSTPLVLAALAGLISERAGVVDISLEGKMLMAAFAGGAVAASSGNPYLGLLAGVLVSVLMGLIHGYVAISARGNQIVSSMAINIIAAGLAPSLAIYFYHRGGQTPFLQDEERFLEISLPFADSLAGIPFIGPLYSDLLSGHTLLTYSAYLMPFLVFWLLYRSIFGLRLRAVGENPEAVDTAGLSVMKLRYSAVILAGILCGVAGVFLSLGSGAPNFIPNMTAGRGYLALAALIFGRWKPIPTLLACLLFGLFDAMQGLLQGAQIPLLGEIPVQFIQVLPYVLTLVILGVFAARMVPPAASGIPYKKER